MPLGVVGVWVVGGGRFSHSSAIQPGARPAVPAVSRSSESSLISFTASSSYYIIIIRISFFSKKTKLYLHPANVKLSSSSSCILIRIPNP